MRLKTFAGIILSVLATQVYAQDNDKTVFQQAMEKRSFIFSAESVNPQRGRTRLLTTEYDLQVRNDSVISFLPFFGRAFTAPINSDGGIKFTSTKFEYSVKRNKKQGWEIHISPGDVSDVRDIYLTVFENGRANLRVNSLNRDPISFTGHIKEIDPVVKKAF